MTAAAVRAGIAKRYLYRLVHFALYHLLQVLGTHHKEVEQHPRLLSSLNEEIHRLKKEASDFNGKNRLAIVNIQDSVQAIHHRLVLIDSGPEFFTCMHVSSTVEAFQAQLEELLLMTLTILVTKMREQARSITKEAYATTFAP